MTISTGHSPDYLLNEVAQGRENYYTGAVAEGEPPGRWSGRGAEFLGLVGLVDAQDMTAVFERFIDPRDPGFRDRARWDEAATLGHTGRAYRTETELYSEALEREPDATAERRTELWTQAGKQAQHNVAFLDATFSVQKSISVLHAAFEAHQVGAERAGDTAAAAAWGQHRQAVEDAIWAGNQAALDYLAEHAGYSRIGHHGGAAGRYVDAHDWTVASFFQHDSRDHDPQLHIHNAILNRVQGPDGQWRTLDSRAMHRFRGAASSVGERTTEEHLSTALGVRFATRPDGKSREVLGVAPEAMALLSARRRAITPKVAELAAAFEERFGRPPNAFERDSLSRQATFATRKAKSHDGETRAQFLDRIDARLRSEVASGLDQVAHDVLDIAQHGPTPAAWAPGEVIATALADVQAKKAAWTRAELTRAVSDALPDHLGTSNGDQVAALLGQLTEAALDQAVALETNRPGDEALPVELRLANGTSAYQAPGARRYAVAEHAATERVLTASVTATGAAAVSTPAAARFLDALRELGIDLGADQAAAVRGVLTSGARVESLVGPAGTGKSFVVGALTKAWTDPGSWEAPEAHRVFGLASSQVATDVLAGEGVTARNVTRWLDTQHRLGEHRGHGDDEAWRLRRGDLVVVDESAMTNTADLAAIHHHIDHAGAKLLLVGDHRQLAAVGAGGGMDMLATAGTAYELTDARRFTAEWEREASLRLRAGDASVLDRYHREGRLRDCGAREQAEASAVRAWLGDTLAGKRSVLLVDTNEQAAQLCAEVRAELVRLGRVEEHGVRLDRQGTFAGVGDLVQARRNGWNLAGYRGNQGCPINRQTYRVIAVGDDGGLTVAPITGHTREVGEQHGAPLQLPARYVAEHVALGYASTVHAAQGMTVDTSHTVVTPRTSPEALYVGMSRGREANTAHVTTRAITDPDAPTGTVNTDAVHRSPAAVLAATLDGADPTKSALTIAVESADEAASVRTAGELFADAVELATAGRTATWLDQLTETGTLTPAQRARIAAEDGTATLTRVLRRAELAGHDPHQMLTNAIGERDLGDARRLTNVIYKRITSTTTLDPVGDDYTGRLPTVTDPEWARYLAVLARRADARAGELGEQVAAEMPVWAHDGMAQVPDDPTDRDAWVRRAGAIAAHRELSGHDDPETALGPPPKAGQPEAYASWRAAWRALGRPEAQRDELEMSDGQLLVRMRARDREKAWAPRYVGNELAATTQAATSYRHTKEVRAAEATITTDPAERARLDTEARQAEAMAELLDERIGQLRVIERARGEHLLHIAETCAAGDRSEAEYTARHADDHQPEPQVTAPEWFAADRIDRTSEDAHRPVTDEADFADVLADRERDQTTDGRHEAPRPETTGTDEPFATAPASSGAPEPEPHPTEPQQPTSPSAQIQPPTIETGRDDPQPVTPEPDIREVAASEPAEQDEDRVQVPTQESTTASVTRAQRALAEVRARTADDAQREDAERNTRRARWQADRVAEQAQPSREVEL